MLIMSLKFRLNRRFHLPPPPPSSNFDAGIVQSAFTRLHELLDKFQGRRTPPREYLGSDRRSPTAGPSDIARPNPLAQVSDRPPRAQTRPLDLQRLRMSLLPRVLATIMLQVLANLFLHVLEETNGSMFALGAAEFRPQSDFGTSWNAPTPRFPSLGI